MAVPDPSSTRLSYRRRRSYGLLVEVKGQNTFTYFNHFALLSVVVNAIVIISFPASIVYWIMLYGAGMLSDIYYKAACQEFDIYKSFAGVGSRMIAATIAFRGI